MRAMILVVGLLWLCLPPAAALAAPSDDLRAANTTVQRALTSAKSADLGTARQTYDTYENTWFDIEDGVRGASRDSYVAIEKAMTGVTAAFAATPPDRAQVISALTALDAEQQRFLQVA